MKHLSAPELKSMLDRKEDLFLVNVLPHDSYQEKHIPGSVNVPVGEDGFLKRMERIARDKSSKIVVYCADEQCNASPTAAKKLEEVGYENLYDFDGGVQEWEESKLPLEGSLA